MFASTQLPADPEHIDSSAQQSLLSHALLSPGQRQHPFSSAFTLAAERNNNKVTAKRIVYGMMCYVQCRQKVDGLLESCFFHTGE
mmetsp:Transcript_491/g.736  ORF Transcript_491/g.736 Transcript_491/m.736 type:complete len:85 (-) Transcript_491:20-274(-)